MTDIAISIVILLLQLFLGILFAILSVYFSLRIFDRMTEHIDEIAELRRGNVAVAIVLLALIISIATIVNQGVQQFDSIFASKLSLPFFIIAFVMAIVQLVIVLLISIFTIYTSIKVLDTMTVGLDELKELKRGNVAVALLIAGVIFAVSFIVASAINGIGDLPIFKPETLAAFLGIV